MRFIVANRISGSGSREAKREQADRAEASLSLHTEIRRDNKPKSMAARRVLVVETDPADMPKLMAQFDGDVIVEPELPRYVAETRCSFLDEIVEQQGDHPSHAGLGTALDFEVLADGKGVPGAAVMVVLSSLVTGSQSTRLEMTTDGDGKVHTHYDSARFYPSLLAIEPKSCYWSLLVPSPENGASVQLDHLPKVGPSAWWKQVAGQRSTDETGGAGIKVGVIDTGLGPHPYLKHVKGLGAITGKGDQMKPAATADVRSHGTHVAGIIAARPVAGSGDYDGIASGADVAAIRVFDAEGGAHQGDIAEAIDAMAQDFEADLINLSLGSTEPSAIERDAVMAAFEVGCLAIASAGNDRGAPPLFPAAYPETIAVSALGLLGTSPPNTIAGASAPIAPEAYSPYLGGLFVANFSNAGPPLICSAPGVGIISTVPTRPEVSAPYGVKNGTSMAAPIVTGALATVLAHDETYKALPRDATRATYAAQVLLAILRQLGIAQPLAGFGLVTAHMAPAV
ncbi:MAG: S8 family serine peptidase [Litoreibacter sp.]